MTIVKRYTATWCRPCAQLIPIMGQLSAENPNVSFQTIDIEVNKSVAEKLGIRSLPTVIIEKDGVETSRIVGLQPKSVYERAIV